MTNLQFFPEQYYFGYIRIHPDARGDYTRTPDSGKTCQEFAAMSSNINTLLALRALCRASESRAYIRLKSPCPADPGRPTVLGA